MKKATFVTVKVKSLKVKIMYFDKNTNQVNTLETTVDCNEKSLDKYCRTLIPKETIYLQTEVVESIDCKVGISKDVFDMLAIKVVELNGVEVLDLSSDTAKLKSNAINNLKNVLPAKIKRVEEIGFEAYEAERRANKNN